MKNAIKILSAGSAIAMAMTASAFAADLAVPEYVEPPVFQAPEHVPASMSGWYIRGDVGYSWNKHRNADWNVAPAAGTIGTVEDGFITNELKGAFSVGGGIGYQLNHYARVDATLDYDFASSFNGSTGGVLGSCTVAGVDDTCISSDSSSFTALTLLANAYVDLGTYNGFTPYVGAGIGGARVHWSTLTNTIDGTTTGAVSDQDGVYTHNGNSDWRFAYALMAGVSYEVSKKVSLDLGYRYRKITGGHAWDIDNETSSTGPIKGKGIDSHQIRAGLRYKFGGSSEAPILASNPVYK